MKKRLLALVAALSMVAVPIKAEEQKGGLLTVDNLKDLRTLCAVVGTTAEGVEFATGTLTEDRTDQLLRDLAKYPNELYKILAAALEEGEFIASVKDIILEPFNKAHKVRNEDGSRGDYQSVFKGYGNWNKDLGEFGWAFLEKFAEETAHTTAGKLIGSFLEGKENRIFRRILNVIARSISSAVVVYVVEQARATGNLLISPKQWSMPNKDTLKKANPLSWGWRDENSAVGKCMAKAFEAFQMSLFYEFAGELLIRAAEGDESPDLERMLLIDQISDIPVRALFGRE